MLFRKRDHLVGLDIGSSSIKVAELQTSKKGTVLKKFGVAQVPFGAIVEGRVVDMEGVADIIRTLFKSQKIMEKNVAISTGGHSVVIKTINTSKVPDKELHGTIHSEAEQYIPYDIDDVNIDYQILGDNEFSPDQMNVLLVAVKKDLVAEYIDLITLAGLTPQIIDVDTFALQNIYEFMPSSDSEEVTLLVDVGASKTSLNILKGNISLMMRDNVSGTNQILEQLSSKLDISIEEAENMFRDGENVQKNLEVLSEISQSVANTWCSEICEVVYTFQSSSDENKVEKIVLSGGGGFVEGFSDSLKSELDVDVVVINPFEGLILDGTLFPVSFISGVGLQAPIALGLALRRVDDK
ncbi:MAG: type IV pilus assembly protein PilM [Desulfobacteraceae bacterium]|nr:type IV pilus assembly protein PilM [Desulfobacteraceae bacterium]